MTNKIVRLAGLLSVFLFSALCCFTACFAWYSANRHVNGSGMQIRVSDEALCAQYTIYKYDEGNNIISSKDPNDLVLKTYDLVITEKNEYTPIIIKFDITGSTITNGEQFTVNFTCEETDSYTHYISNIIKFDIGCLDISSTDPEIIYNTASEQVDKTDLLFVNNEVKQTNLSYYVSNYNSMVKNDVLSLYIKLDYSKTLIQNNFSEIEIATEQTSGGYIFENDLTRIELNE